MAITPAALDHGSHSGGGTPITTNSATATAGRLTLVAVHSLSTTSVTPAAPTLSGLGGTWANVVSNAYDSSGTGQARLDVFRAVDASGSGALSIAYASGVPDIVIWSTDDYAGADPAAGPSVNGIVQSVTASGTAANPTLSLAALASALNVAVGLCGTETDAATNTLQHGGSFAELTYDNVVGQNQTEVEWAANQTTVNWVRPGSNTWGALAFELSAATGGGGATQTVSAVGGIARPRILVPLAR